MSYAATIFNVMIASPGDVNEERALARDIINEWNAIHSASRAMALMPIGWETHSHPSMDDRPQGVLNGQILEDADLLVAIFWTRIGSPTGEAVSGSVEEIERHLKAGKPAMIYFSSAPVRPESVIEKQYQALVEFKKQLETRGLYEVYDTPSAFAEKFRRQLATKINNDLLFHVEGAGVGRETLINDVLREAAEKIPALSDEAKTLLVEASKDNNGTLIYSRFLSGESLSTNGKEFLENATPRDRARWEGALRDLEMHDLIKDQGYKGEIFELTREGYDVAELLAP
ncbi:hypothetical protein ACVOMS_17615 [Bradyrhizobium guangxiense]